MATEENATTYVFIISYFIILVLRPAQASSFAAFEFAAHCPMTLLKVSVAPMVVVGAPPRVELPITRREP